MLNIVKLALSLIFTEQPMLLRLDSDAFVKLGQAVIVKLQPNVINEFK
jgi:hypothetical protein